MHRLSHLCLFFARRESQKQKNVFACSLWQLFEQRKHHVLTLGDRFSLKPRIDNAHPDGGRVETVGVGPRKDGAKDCLDFARFVGLLFFPFRHHLPLSAHSLIESTCSIKYSASREGIIAPTYLSPKVFGR